MSVLGEAAAIIALGKTAGEVISILDDVFKFRKDCLALQGSCDVIKLVLNQYSCLLNNDPAIVQLKKTLDECYKYLDECKKRKIRRNPLFAVLFNPQIKKFKEVLDAWTTNVLLSLEVIQSLIVPVADL
jgi:hypothetical protein